MKIGIMAFGCDHGRSGFGSYLTSFISNLPRQPGLSFEVFGPELDRYTYTNDNPSVTYFGVNIPDSKSSERLWVTTSCGSLCKKRRYDGVIFPLGIRLLPLKFDVPSVVVVQDVLSDLIRFSKDKYYKISSLLLKKAGGIIAATDFIKKDMVDNLKIDGDSVSVVYSGLDRNRFYPRPKNNESTILIQPFSIRRPYIIYASRIEHPRKHHVELIRGFEIFKERTGLPHRLVLAGSDGENAEMVHRSVIKSAVSQDIFLTGFFPPQNLPELYAGADACIFPSSCEGVGLPVLETMACGIPVACSNAGSLPEITGKNALLFNSENPEEIASAIEQLVRNSSLREELISNAVQWAGRFSWEENVNKTVGILRNLVEKS